MKPATSLCFILTTVSVVLLNAWPDSKISRISGWVSSFFLISTGSLVLYEYSTELVADGTGFSSSSEIFHTLLNNTHRMALVSSAMFIIVGILLIILTMQYRRLYGLVHTLALLIFLVNYFVPMSFITGINSFFIVSNIPIALLTGINFILLAAVIMLWFPDTWLMRVFLDENAGGNVARRLIPGIVLIPVIVSWLRFKGEQMGIFNSQTGIILSGVTYTFCFLILTWIAARKVIKIDNLQRDLNVELERNAHFIRTITGTIPDLISIIELPSLKLIYLNKGSFTQQGLDTDMFLNLTFNDFLDLVHPDDRQAVSSFMAQLAEYDKDDLLSIEYRLKNKDDTWMWFRTRSKVFERSGGIVKSCINIVQNITPEKEAEIRLVTSELRFRTLADNISQLVWIIDNNGKYLWFNKQWLEYTGITLEEMQQGGISRVVHPDYLADAMNSFLQAVEKKEIWKTVFPMRSYNGEYRWFINQALPIFDSEGNVVHWFVTNTDIHEQKTAEDRAVLLTKQLEDLLKSIPIGVLVVDNNLNIIRTNAAAIDLLGYSTEQLKLNFTDRFNKLFELHTTEGTLLKPEEMPVYKAAINNETIINRILHFSSSKKKFWGSFTSAPYIVEGNKTGAVLSITDITEVRRAEEELFRSREELMSITENSPDLIARFDTSSKHIFINTIGEKIYGRPRDKIIGKSFAELDMPGYMIDFWKKNFDDIILSGELKNVEFDFVSSHSGHQFFHVFLVPEKDARGNMISILAIARDITKLRDVEEKFKALFENISEGVAIHDIVYRDGVPVDYRILDVNPAYETISGIKCTDAVGKLATELYQSPEPPFFDVYLKVARTGEPYRFETYFKEIDKYFMIDAVSPGNGKFATVFEDITDHKKTEIEIKKKNEELTRFIYTVSHDLKSPLVTIKSFLAYLKEDIEKNDTNARERDMRYIDNAAEKMGNLLHELLELSRIGRKEQPKQEISMKSLARAAIDLVAGRMTGSNIKILMTGPDVILYGHYQRLLQLFMNLLDNAIKFMGNQPDPLIEIGSLRDPAHKDPVVFVRDNGLGIDPKYHDKVFGLFEKLDNNTEGTGIGLALIKRIVEVHNGSVWFTSEGQGRGTTFFFTLEAKKQ